MSCPSFTKEDLNLLVILQMHVQERDISLAVSRNVPGRLHSPQGACGPCDRYTESRKFFHFSWISYWNQLVKMYMWTRISKDLTEKSASEEWQEEDICAVNVQILLDFWQDSVFWNASLRSKCTFTKISEFRITADHYFSPVEQCWLGCTEVVKWAEAMKIQIQPAVPGHTPCQR